MADLELDPALLESFKGDPMLVYENDEAEERVIILATQQNLLLLNPDAISLLQYVDRTFKVDL